MRLRGNAKYEIVDEQYGFVTGKGTQNAIFNIRILAERAIEMERGLFISFIDYTKAFDKVKHDDMFEILEKIGVDGKDLKLLTNFHWEPTATICIDNELGKWVEINRVARQGCVASPDMKWKFARGISTFVPHHLHGSSGVLA